MTALTIGAVSFHPGCTARFAEGRYALVARPANATCLAPAPGESRVRLEPAFGGRTFESPVDMLERDGRFYVAELAGAVELVDGATNAVATAVDLAPAVGVAGRLTGIALHPTKPHLFVAVDHFEEPFYSEVWRLESADGARTFAPESRSLVLRVDRPTTLHGIGQLRFDARGHLFVGHGDGGSNGGEAFTQYDPTTLLGSMFRLDVDGASPYAIPPDNPYASGGGGRPEIYAGGLRNPWRFSFDRETGELWAGDVGDRRYEEIDVIERGKNYGWPALEGNACLKPRDNCDRAGKEPPVYEYAQHSGNGASVTGGYVYRGRAMPDFVGRYVFADFVNGRIYALTRRDGGAPLEAEVLNGSSGRGALVGFGEDSAGELYVIDFGGPIYRLAPGAPTTTDPIPTLLSKTGCVDPNEPTRLAPGLIPYGVNAELWSDGADKERAFAIPDGTQITVDEEGRFLFPDGSVLVKTFFKDGRRLETRLLFHHTGVDWTAYSYAWNEDETEATRVDDVTTIRTRAGDPWEIPGPNQCFFCHREVSKTVLGLELAQLDGAESRSAPYDQLPTLARIGVLDPNALAQRGAPLARVDGDAPVEQRARSYLHANCSFCHRPYGPAPVPIDLRISRPIEDLYGCYSALPIPAFTDGRLLSPGDPGKSAILARMSMRANGYQMPPLASAVPDAKAIAVLAEWIGALPRCP